MRHLRYARWWIGVGLMLVLVVLYFCLEPPSQDRALLVPDKLSHGLAFFGLTAWFAALVERRHYAFVAITMLGLGIAIELLQDWMSLGRTAEVADVYADALGVLAGVVVSMLIRESWLQRVERWLP
ncbi:MAG: VanZ family protein, partial [Steroidobacteraceae bacterium]